jgi:hypothetical protein
MMVMHDSAKLMTFFKYFPLTTEIISSIQNLNVTSPSKYYATEEMRLNFDFVSSHI